ncbi:MAG TPA: SCO family protein [Paraburkholderia sp.]|jgi:protein SCO1/2|uniref:SCO family protein n=1 Tax=Paraburkholderia sp. TaxID=1926495 RepID=UPI002B488320|nr:SCO family protein [Paraburkholderia sp.]HKR39911.1 SCO family protein [Paraburkholderia sp.]
MKRFHFLLCALLLSMPAAFAAPSSLSLPGDSLYQTSLTLQDQQGRQFDLASMRGQPLIVSMFYTACSAACPLTIDTIQQIRRAASAPDRGVPSVLLVSIDPQHDDVVNLAAMAKAHGLDAASWRLTRSTAGDLMAFAAALGVAYRQRTNSDFSHNAVIALLDENGRIVAHTSVIGGVDPAFVSAVRARSTGH